jgi:hypothetical protein
MPVFNEEQSEQIVTKLVEFVPDTKTKYEQDQRKIEKIEFKEWKSSTFLPTFFDNELKKLYYHRSYFYSIQSGANSTYDYGKDLNSLEELVKYIPRAIQIGLFSPFPKSWFAEHQSQLSKLMHIITGMEMLFIYICLLGFIISLFIWKKKIEFWMFVCFCFYFILVPSYAIPNIGTLIRYRYGAIMLLAAIGISTFLKLYNLKIANDKK